MESTVAQSIKKFTKTGGTFYLIFVDIDFFKKVNDTMGHKVGDDLIIHLGRQLKLITRTTDRLFRLGGDEFVVLLDGVTSKEQVIQILDRFYSLLSVPVVIEEHTIFLSSSLGISSFPNDGSTVHELLEHADDALYVAKESGKNQYQFYSALSG